MAAMQDAVDVINDVLSFEHPFPSREALGPRPNRQSQAAMSDLITPQAEQLLQNLYADDLSLYGSIISDEPI